MHALDAIATALPGPDAITTALIAMKAIEDAQLKVEKIVLKKDGEAGTASFDAD